MVGVSLVAPAGSERSDPPILALTLWPHRSLSPRGFSRVLAAVAFGLCVPLVPLIGASMAWGLLPFLVATLVGLYLAARRNFRDARLSEELRLWPDLITVERREPKGDVRHWHANPAWVRVCIFEDARIEKYLTLTGNGREIELGSFLSPGERVALHRDLHAALGPLRAR